MKSLNTVIAFSVVGLLFSVHLWTVAFCQADLMVDLNDTRTGETFNLTVEEGNSGTMKNKEICIVIPNSELQDNPTLSVLSGSTATDGNDFSVSEVLDIPVESSGDGFLKPASLEACFNVTIIGDDLVEDSPETAFLRVTFGTNFFVDINVNIQDDDEIAVQLGHTNYSVNEGDGGILVCASIVSGMLERSVTLSLSTRDGSATSGSTGPRDFSAITTELTFDPHTSMTCANISVKDDRIVESPETFMVLLSGSDSGVKFVAPTTAVVTINDNDKVTVGFDMDQYLGEEGRSTIVCATVKGSTSLERLVLVRLSTSDSTASAPEDYRLDSKELTFNASQNRSCVPVMLNSDNILEETEEFQVVLTSPEDQPVLLDTDRAMVAIMDTNRITIGVEFSEITVNEGAGTIEVCASNTSGAALERVVNLTLSTEDGRATSDVPRDFTAVSLPLQMDMTKSRACVTVAIDDDGIVEDAESFDVVVRSTDKSVNIWPLSTTIVIIEDNDNVTIGLEMNQYYGEEGRMTDVCAIVNGTVSLERRVMVQLTTNYATASAPQDYQGLNSIDLTFNASQSRSCVSIMLKSDNILEETEEFRLLLSSSQGGQAVVFGTNNVPVSIIDTNRVTIGVEAHGLTVNEGDRTVKVCARQTNEVTLERRVTFTLSTEDGKATSDVPRDFVAMTNKELKVDETQSRDCADVAIEDDSVVEDAENFRVVVSSSDTKVDIGNSTTVVSIKDNDKVVIDLDKDKYLGDGKDPFEVCGILRNATTEKTLSTQFLVGDEADHFGIIFKPGETMKCTTIKFGRYDNIETFELSLTSDDQAAILTNAVIDVAVVPKVVFTRDRLSVEIAVRGLTVATFNMARQQLFKDIAAKAITSYCQDNPCRPVTSRQRQSSARVMAEDIVIGDLKRNEQNHLQFRMLVLSSGRRVISASSIKNAVEASDSAFRAQGFAFEKVQVAMTPNDAAMTTTSAPARQGLSPGATTGLVVVFTVIFLLVIIFSVMAVFKCGERAYQLKPKGAQFKSPKSTSHIQVETINMRALAERKDSLDEEVKAAEAAAEVKDTQVSVTIDL